VVSRIWVGDDDVRRKKAVEFVTEGLESDALKPVIDRIVAFDDIREAHRLLRLNCR
jgi:NADPH:quinone reductase-like Zn-dependent oxidoreductase